LKVVNEVYNKNAAISLLHLQGEQASTCLAALANADVAEPQWLHRPGPMEAAIKDIWLPCMLAVTISAGVQRFVLTSSCKKSKWLMSSSCPYWKNPYSPLKRCIHIQESLRGYQGFYQENLKKDGDGLSYFRKGWLTTNSGTLNRL
jgi:hypothetical protein